MILCIDSSQNSGSIALIAEERVLYSAQFDIKITHSETLMPAVDYALTFCGVAKHELTAIYVCQGPGSFTGLRIGLATAKGIAFGLNIPLYTFSSLLLSALPVSGMGKNILVCIDAKMKEVYAAHYDSELNELMAPCVLSPQELAAMPFDDFILCGSATPIMETLIKDNGRRFSIPNPILQIPNAAGLYMLGNKLPHLNVPQSLVELEPLYIRESTAQIKANAKA